MHEKNDYPNMLFTGILHLEISEERIRVLFSDTVQLL